MLFRWRRRPQADAAPPTEDAAVQAPPTDPFVETDNPARNLPTNRRLRHVCLPFAIGKGLEVGPFDRPYFTKDEADVDYLDYRTTEECREVARVSLGHDPRFVTELDYVVPPNGQWSMIEDGRYDWILSSHALEHSPNLIAMMLMIAAKLRPGGTMITMLPDKRATFDAHRPVSTLGQIIEDHLRDTRFPRPQGVFDQYYYARPLSMPEARSIDADPARRLPQDGDFTAAMAAAQDALSRYQDVHNYVFTSHSFEHITSVLCAEGVIPFRPVLHQHTPDDDMTFINILERTG